MASPNPWADFENYKNSLRHNTVAKLQTIILGWTEQNRSSLAKSGKKQDLIDRMVRALNQWKDYQQVDEWLRAKAVMDQVRETGQYSQYAMPPHLDRNRNQYQQLYTPAPPTATTTYPTIKQDTGTLYPAPGVAGPSRLHYDPYAPARKAVPGTAASVSSTKPSIRFKSSPFFRPDQPVSAVVECPESTSAMDRRSQSLSFTLTPEQVTKLQAPNVKYQLRLFCTSSSWHNPHGTGFRTELPCPVEFPPTCEVRVNNVQLTANLKGLKKRPGTAPPPDLGQSIRMNNGMQNRVDMVYVNSQQPIQPKKYYMIVCLVEATTVEQLVDKLKKGKYKSEEDIRAKMVQSASLDDDIIAGPQKMSLKCPLSYTRVTTPCRSIQCPHAQCFDAFNWFSMMEQTTTWLCPVCDKTLNVEELIIDGYFDRILKDTPDSVEDVMVEADGEWHTSDNKYASARWRAVHVTNGVVPRSKSPLKVKKEEKPANTLNSQEVISLTDSEDDEQIVKGELSPTTSSLPASQSRSNLSTRSTAREAEVIDLTLDSDDDDPVPSTEASYHPKRKDVETSPSNEGGLPWKRPRIDGAVPASPIPRGESQPYNSYTNGTGLPVSLPDTVMNGSHASFGSPPTGNRREPPLGPTKQNSFPSYPHPVSPPGLSFNHLTRPGSSESPGPSRSQMPMGFLFPSQSVTRRQ